MFDDFKYWIEQYYPHNLIFAIIIILIFSIITFIFFF
jgi:hypothetical protein